MPEYLAPGVYVEEVSFRAKTLEGVPTSTTGFAGMARYGPVQYPDGPSTSEPRLITSFTEYERVYGSLTPLTVSGDEWTCYLAHAARAFFENGGKRLYISRTFVRNSALDTGVAARAVAVGGAATATWQARWPGLAGNVSVETRIMRTKNVAFASADFGGAIQARRARAGTVVEILPAGVRKDGNDSVELTQLAVVEVAASGEQSFRREAALVVPAATDTIQIVEMQVIVRVDEERIDVYNELAAEPTQKRYIGHILQHDDPEDENAAVWLDWDPTLGPADAFINARLIQSLQANANPRLTGGNDGQLVTPDDLAGSASDPDDPNVKATGLEALGEIEDIAIVALPDSGGYGDDRSVVAAQKLITHAETLKYRIAVVDGPEGSSLNEIRAFRGNFDSKYGALYHPWIEIFDPTERPAQGAPPKRILLPPSGFVCGIYARSDIERGVHKAPANEVVRGLTRFEVNINKPRQDVLNPEGINALRFFEGRGNRVWGARTLSSDPEWKYVNVRRLFIFIEHTIDRGTQWAVFEPNNRRLWDNIRATVEDFLLVQWRDGALLGDKPEEAYFVRCDRTTMTQNDIDNGRLICLIGIAPTRPAEYVIFRIGQWTADRKI